MIEKKIIPIKFQDKCLCKSCAHDIDLHTESANSISNASFAMPPPASTPQHCHIVTDSKYEHTSQALPTPNHNNFPPPMPGATSETLSCSATTNYQLSKLSN